MRSRIHHIATAALLTILAGAPALAANHLELTMPSRMINDRVFTLKAELRDAVDRIVWQGCSSLGSVTVTRVSDGSDVPITVTVFDPHLTVPDNSIRFYSGVGSVSFTLDGGAAVAPGDVEVEVTFGGVSASRVATIVAPPTFRTMAGALSGTNLVWGPDEFIRVTGGVSISADRTLVIHPGTQVMVNTTGSLGAGTHILVNGAIQAVGTRENPIYFFSERGPLAMKLIQTAGEPSNPDAWRGITHNGSGVNRYEHVILTGAGNGPVPGHPRPPILSFYDRASVVIRDSIFADNNGEVLAGVAGGSYTVQRSLFSRNGIGGEFHGVNHRLLIEDSWFTSIGRSPNNTGDCLHLAGQDVRQVVRGCVLTDGGDDGLDHDASEPLFENSIVYDIRDKIVSIGDTATVDVRNVLFHRARAAAGPGKFTNVTIAISPAAVDAVSIQESILWTGSVPTCSTTDVDYTILGNATHLGCGSGNQAVDPQFQNASACDYRPKVGSPALTAGPTGNRIGWLDFPDPRTCAVDAECDDERTCSTDSCQRGVCVFTPIDGCDCDVPAEVGGLVLAGQQATTLSWGDLGLLVRYDVASGDLADLRPNGVSGATCLADDEPTPTTIDSRVVAPDQGFYYIVRGQNSCGSGPWGRSTWDGPRRPLSSCP